ncbi:response regulator transcription factor [Polynucleobacter sp. Ross1-W9]|uniref:response regulator transcription factor n=1 Tax=Polynucleobacter parvulilacunae TaxID=1855631 RepID=UPI001C0C9EEF|nr:response regulator [Polynucleobacter parvulilacunae]MBU3556210.1 response regulator transcription factor [Polynucleobacter parvulilacunae]
MRWSVIYLIDDDDEMRDSLSGALKRMHYSVTSFSSANDFIESVRFPKSPSVILLDMQMPQMSGIQLQEWLMSNNCQTPIIFISGQSHPQQIIDGLHNGAYRFLLKPFELHELKDFIDGAMAMDEGRDRLDTAYAKLTPREKEVFIELAKGRLVKQIALDRGVSESVIKLHKAQAMKKLGAKSLQALANFYKALNIQ